MLGLYAVLIILTLIGVAVGRYPWLRMNRATIALVGATALIVSGALTLEEAYAALDLNTLTLLFAMMVINVNLRLAGFFGIVGTRVVRWAHTPRQLLALIVGLAGVLSALFLNDTIVLMFTPLVLDLVLTLRRDPIPYLIGLVSAANIGSAATVTGNPQNMLIGAASGISYLHFTAALAPVSLIGLVIIWGVLVTLYPREFSHTTLDVTLQPMQPRTYLPLLRKSLLATGGMLIAFLAGAPIALEALAAASVLLFTRRVKPQRIFRELDMGLLVFFSGLFIVTGAIERTGLSARLFDVARPIAEGGTAALTGVAVILSNLVSNVPAVLLFRPLVPHFPQPELVWLTLAMATTFAGNLTLLGSVANLIVAETARDHGVELSFMAYLKAGVPITLLSLIVGVARFTLF